MSDFLVTEICPECSHVWVYPDVFEHHCPSCGTSTPAIDVERLAGRRERAAKGEKLEPLVTVPEKGTELLDQFKSGLKDLRKVILEHENEAQLLTDHADEYQRQIEDAHYAATPNEKDAVKQLYDRAKAARHTAGRLRISERNISAMLLLADEAEWYPLPRDKKTGKPSLPHADIVIPEGRLWLADDGRR